VEEVALVEDVVTPRDRFFDVATVDGEHAVVVGYGGKILVTDDGGGTWTRVRSPSAGALMRVALADRDHGWIVGQNGVVLQTDDGGRTWRAQESGTQNHLFGLAVVSRDRAFACGDRSQWIATDDGGATWHGGKVPISDVGMARDIAMAVDEPIYYDVTFLDAATGWMVGDYGNIRATTDGGRTWTSQHGTLLGQRLPGAARPLRDALDLPALFRVRMQDRSRGLAVGVAGVVLATADGGGRWSVVDLGLSPRVDAPLLEIALAGGRPLVFGGGATALAPDGDRWRRVDLGLPILTWFVGADFADEGERAGRRGFAVGGRGLILATDDAGARWRPVGPLARAR
jgi:photosystem II stability/assembly factor-like uncharacterized protein